MRTPTLRWLASLDATGPALDAPLARALGTIEIRLPPLRERSDRIEPIAASIAAAWARARREAPRRFDAERARVPARIPVAGQPARARGGGGADARVDGARSARHRRSRARGLALAPLDASAVGTLLPDGEAEAASPSAPRRTRRRGRSARADHRRARARPAATAASRRAIRDDDPGLRRLANALIHQVRNPLATIRTFADLLPERFDDPDFRARFPEMVREDVGRIHGLLARLEQLASLDAPRRDKVDVSEMIGDLLEERREAFRERHHLVLKELDSSRPTALADAAQLRLAFEALFDKALAIVPERGDLYIASRRHEGGGSSGPSVRVLLRFHDPSAGGADALGPLQNSIELLIAELIVRAQGGRLTLGASEAEERVLVVDLPAP